MKDALFFGAVVVTFALAVTFHVVLVVGLARRSMMRGVAAFVVPPLAPYWGFAAGMKARSTGWIASVVLYAVAILVEPR